MRTKVKSVNKESITFENGLILESSHVSDCCEHHWLSFEDLKLEDFDGLEFDFSNDEFFERVPDYGIRLLPTNGHPISVPGYGSNNGYYSTNLDLILYDNRSISKSYNITECQVIND